MSTVEYLDNGKVCLNVFDGDNWIKHIFSDIETLDKYYNKAINSEYKTEANISN